MNVLLPIDGSECSGLAVREIATRAWHKGTKLKILAVVERPVPYPIPDPFLTLEGIRINLMKEERQRLTKLVEETAASVHTARKSSKLDIETEVIDDERSAKAAIVDEAEKWDADLIVIGSHGYGNVKRFVLGSVSQAVAAHAPCSVEIVRCKKANES
jgi:nucleotide-binding universal stress UspA family protein